MQMETSPTQQTQDVPPQIGGIIVSYHPSEELVAVVKAIRGQVTKLLIVDNASEAKGTEVFERLAGVDFEIIRNPENLGIATALNQGLAWARGHGLDWVLTLDQDTVCEADMVERMFDAYRASVGRERIAVLAPVHFDRKSGHLSAELSGLGTALVDCNYVMTSGNLVPLAIFDKIGTFDESFFIDYVDHDFCLRAKKNGLRVVLVPSARMGHNVGNLKRHSIAGLFSFFSHNYRPERHYYRYRNRIILYRRYFGSWIWHDQRFALGELVKVYLVEKDRWKKTKAMFRGTVDGLLNRLGPMGRPGKSAGSR